MAPRFRKNIVENIVNVLLSEVTGMIGAPLPSTLAITASGSPFVSRTTSVDDDEDAGGKGSLKTQPVAIAGAKTGTSNTSSKNINHIKSVGFNQKVTKSKSPLGVFDAKAEKE